MTRMLVSASLCCLSGLSLLVSSGYAQDQLWSARLSLTGRSDVPTSVAIDSEANVFVTGRTTSGQNTHDVTVSYDALGAERWVSENHPDSACFREIHPQVVVLNSTGDPMIAGSVICEDDAQKGFVQCLSGETGSALWRFRGSSPDGFWTPFGGLASDGAGGAYFVIDLDFGPWAIGAARLQANGLAAWNETLNGHPQSLDGSTVASAPNLLYIAGSVNWVNTYVTALSSDGSPLWNREFDFVPDPSTKEGATASATDMAGNVAVLLLSPGVAPTGPDYEVLKLSPSGQTLWHATYDAALREDAAAGIACDTDGSVYVTGTSWGGAATGEDLVTVKFGPSGGPPEWVARVAGVGSGADEGRAIEVASGSVFVTGGIYQGATRQLDAITLRYDANGQEVWREIYSGPEGDDIGVDLATSEGRIAVAGTSEGADGFGSDFFTVMYSHSPVAVPLPDPAPETTRLLVSPNPSSGACSFRFAAGGGQRAEIRLHDLNGHLIRRLSDNTILAGERLLHWDGKDEGGQPVPNGVYFVSVVGPPRSTPAQRITIVR